MSADSQMEVPSNLRLRVLVFLRPSAEKHLVDVESVYPLCATVAKLVDY